MKKKKKKNEDLQTAVTSGNIDRELSKITPIFLAVVEQSTVSEAINRFFNTGGVR